MMVFRVNEIKSYLPLFNKGTTYHHNNITLQCEIPYHSICWTVRRTQRHDNSPLSLDISRPRSHTQNKELRTSGRLQYLPDNSR